MLDAYAILHQVRSGVKRLRVIDFDQVSLSSLNRHAVATWGDVGYPKVRNHTSGSRSCLMNVVKKFESP